jgi:hypothetical protein
MIEIVSEMIIGATVKIPIGVHRVRKVGGGVPSMLAVLIRSVGMIEALATVQHIMAILVADLAHRLGASTAMTTTSMA